MHGGWGGTCQGMNKQLVSMVDMQTSCISPTRWKGMVSNVMHWWMQDYLDILLLQSTGTRKVDNTWVFSIAFPYSGKFDQLEEKYHNCWFDNLYQSAKFAKAAYKPTNKVQISGPTWKGGWGLPKCVIQKEMKMQTIFALYKEL